MKPAAMILTFRIRALVSAQNAGVLALQKNVLTVIVSYTVGELTERAERLDCRPIEPDPDNAGEGNGTACHKSR